jgi:hypothetical protein
MVCTTMLKVAILELRLRRMKVSNRFCIYTGNADRRIFTTIPRWRSIHSQRFGHIIVGTIDRVSPVGVVARLELC